MKASNPSNAQNDSTASGGGKSFTPSPTKSESHALEIPAISLPFFEKPQNAPSPFLRRLHSILQQHYGNEAFNVTTLSKTMCLCPMQFHRKVKQQTGLTPGKYLLLFRFEKAIHSLLSSEDSIGEIAFLVGFSNQNNFTRAFKREFGYCPNRFRQNGLKGYK